MSQQHSAALEGCAVKKSTAALDRHLAAFLKSKGAPRLPQNFAKAIPASDSGVEPSVRVVAARESLVESPGPIFRELISAAEIVDGGTVDSGVRSRFDARLAEQLGAGSGSHLQYGKARRAKSEDEEAERSVSAKSKSQSRSSSASQDAELERFAAALDHELRKSLHFGKGHFRRGAQVITRDGDTGTVLEKSGAIVIRTSEGHELHALPCDVAEIG